MNIQVNNLDQGYAQCETLNNLVRTEGEALISKLGNNITNLTNHWKGADATAHITNLITVYNGLVNIVSVAKKITSTAGAAMSAIQEVRRANGGSGEVGALLPNNAPEAASLQAPESTGEYYCDPSAKTDLADLGQLCNDFSTFKSKFNTEKESLLSNWLSGASREAAIQALTAFEENSETYAKFITSAQENLEIAVSNISSLDA